MKRILVIDDEESMRHMLSLMLEGEGYDVTAAADGAEGLRALEQGDYDLVLCDIRMPGLDGLSFLKEFGKSAGGGRRPVIVMMSAYGTIDTAVECMRLGAYDYISKPFRPDEVALTIRKAEERERLRRENERLRGELSMGCDLSEIVAADRAMLEVLDTVRKVADYDSTVLITGESGTGKELVARALHFSGARREGPFIAVNCGAIPQGLMESELFGHVKGAFTDAVRTRAGLFEEADGGTVFLDEVGELEPAMQVKLLRVLQEGEFRRVGETRVIRVDVRVVAATNRDPSELVAAGRLRRDLYYRLNVIPLRLPPLRERGDDITALAGHFLARFSARFSKRLEGFTAEAEAALRRYSWPGNVRELENVVERAVILADGDRITAALLPFGGEHSAGPAPEFSFPSLSIKKAHAAVERRLIEKALEETGGNKTRAAALLDISLRALIYKIKMYGL
ncbi:MAG TPA: sigma-54-dependent Fis family transcriptional regulator [Deltaproteobacteria bacterium]|nr:sigma-54-dependent Fis family transcriptional regulator [Deltaproteobacteria bacterium]